MTLVPEPAGHATSDTDGAQRVLIGGVTIDCLSRQSLAERMVADWHRNVAADRRLAPQLVFDANGQALSLYARKAGFRTLSDRADIMVADGMSLVFASRWLTRTPLPERVALTDAFHDLAAAAEAAGMSFYFLGAKPEANAAAVARVRTLYPDLKIAGCRDGYFPPEETEAIVADVVASGADVLWVAMGRERQEQFAVDQAPHLTGVTWIKTCGGMFDFLTGTVKRAPDWMQRAGLEWLYRMWQEPRRLFMRYLITNPHAIYRMLVATRSLPDGGRPSTDFRSGGIE